MIDGKRRSHQANSAGGRPCFCITCEEQDNQCHYEFYHGYNGAEDEVVAAAHP
jgi:hypothetical protein